MTDRYSDDADVTDYYGGEEPPTPEDPKRTGEDEPKGEEDSLAHRRL